MFKDLKMIMVLTISGLLSGGFLSFVYERTLSETEEQSLESLRRAVFAVLPQAVNYRKIELGKEVLYQGEDNAGRKVGLAFLAAGRGYQGEIKIMVGLRQDLAQIQNIAVLESVETPGLGGRIAEDNFLRQFEDLSVTAEIELAQGPPAKLLDATGRPEVQAITGATISSKAVVDTINQRVAEIREMAGKLLK